MDGSHVRSSVFVAAALLLLSALRSVRGQPPTGTPTLDCAAYVNNPTYTATNEPYQSRLHGCFLKNTYDVSQIPVQSSSSTGYLSMNYSFAVVDFHSFDDTGSIKFFYQLALQWYDFHRQWNNTVIPVNFIEVPLTQLWYPRFQLINTDDKVSVNLVNASNLNAQIYYNSLITLYINDILSGSCDVDLTSFPFDTQVCELNFRLDRYFFNSIDLVLSQSGTAYVFDGLENDEWEYLNESDIAVNYSSKSYKFLSNGSIDKSTETTLSNFQTGFQVKIGLKRYVAYYIINLVVPIILLTILGFITFMMGDESEIKVELPFTVVLGFMFMQAVVSALVPKSEKTPMLAWYILGSLFQAVIAVMFAIITSIVKSSNGRPSAAALRVMVFYIGFPVQPSRWCCCCKKSDNEAAQENALGSARSTRGLLPLVEVATPKGEHSASNTSSTNNMTSETPVVHLSNGKEGEENNGWSAIANVLNRYFAIAYVIIAIVLFCVFLVPLFFL